MSGRPVARRSRTPVPAAALRGSVRRRASAGLSATRAGAALVMLLAAVAIYGVGASSAFSYADLQVSGASLTDQSRIEDAVVGRPRPEPVRAQDRSPRGRPRADPDGRATQRSMSACRGRSP